MLKAHSDITHEGNTLDEALNGLLDEVDGMAGWEVEGEIKVSPASRFSPVREYFVANARITKNPDADVAVFAQQGTRQRLLRNNRNGKWIATLITWGSIPGGDRYHLYSLRFAARMALDIEKDGGRINFNHRGAEDFYRLVRAGQKRRAIRETAKVNAQRSDSKEPMSLRDILGLKPFM